MLERQLTNTTYMDDWIHKKGWNIRKGLPVETGRSQVHRWRKNEWSKKQGKVEQRWFCLDVAIVMYRERCREREREREITGAWVIFWTVKNRKKEANSMASIKCDYTPSTRGLQLLFFLLKFLCILHYFFLVPK